MKVFNVHINAPGGEALDGTPTQAPHVKPDSQTMPLNIPRTKCRGNKIVIWFKYKGSDHKVIYQVVGREAQTLLWLYKAGKSGITAAEVSCWALRLSAYVYELRHQYGLSIRTDHDLHNGGWHGRYVLESSIEILPNNPTV
jgi:hypothetical protein